MADESVEVPQLFQTVRDKINEKLVVLVASGVLRESVHESNGLDDCWTVELHNDSEARYTYRSVDEIIAFLQGLEAQRAYQAGLEQYEVISRQLDSLLYRGILTFKKAHGYPSGDWSVCLKEGEAVHLANIQQARDFLFEHQA